MSLLWWQNGRDIDWFSTNLEKWIKPGVVSTNPNSAQAHGGRYSKLKSCRLSKTCQTMMYIPQEQQGRDLSYEEQLARFQDNRPYKYSQRQEHYNSHYNYIRTSARRAYYKPETQEIVLADEYDKIQTIQRQNRDKNYDYLLILQQFLKHQNTKARAENLASVTSYLNDNIHQYEQTDQTITLKQFLQEGIEKHEHDHLVTLKEFLQEKPRMPASQQSINIVKEANDSNVTILNEAQKGVTLQECLNKDYDNNMQRTFIPTNPFTSEIQLNNNRNNPFLAQEENKSKIEVSEEVSFEEFLKERQNTNCRKEGVKITNNISPRLDTKVSPANSVHNPHSVDNNDKLSLNEFLNSQNIQPSPIIKRPGSVSPRPHPKVTFADPRSQSEESDDKISFDEFLKDRNTMKSFANINKTFATSPRHIHSQIKSEVGAEKRSQSLNNNKVTFDEFLKEKHHLGPCKIASEKDKAMTLDEFLKSEPDLTRLGKSNEYRPKEKLGNNLKLSKSFNDRTNMIKDSLIKKLTRIEVQNENGTKKGPEENNNENKITLYEFLKEEDKKQTEVESCLKNLKLRTKHDDDDNNEMFYEINNNAPEIKLNDNIIQVETKTPEIKYNQHENNKHVCVCDHQIFLTGKLYNENYSQLLYNTPHGKIEFIDKSFDYHRNMQQDNMCSPFHHRTNNKLFNSMHTGRRSRSKNRTCASPVPVRGCNMDEQLYGPVWPSVLLTYDKVISPNQMSMACSNESYA